MVSSLLTENEIQFLFWGANQCIGDQEVRPDKGEHLNVMNN